VEKKSSSSVATTTPGSKRKRGPKRGGRKREDGPSSFPVPEGKGGEKRERGEKGLVVDLSCCPAEAAVRGGGGEKGRDLRKEGRRKRLLQLVASQAI